MKTIYMRRRHPSADRQTVQRELTCQGQELMSLFILGFQRWEGCRPGDLSRGEGSRVFILLSFFSLGACVPSSRKMAAKPKAARSRLCGAEGAGWVERRQPSRPGLLPVFF